MMVLRISANLVAPVEVKPQSRAWLTAIAGQEATMVLLLHRHDGKPLRVTGVRINNPELLATELAPVEAPENRNGLKAVPGDVWLEVKLKPQAGAVSRGTRIDLSTDVPDMPQVRIPVTVRIRAKVEAAPPRVQLILPAEGDTRIRRRLHIRDNTRARLRVLEAVSDHPELFTAEIVSKAPSSDQVITVWLTEKAASMELRKRIFAKLTVKTDDPAAKELEVPVEIWRAPKRRPAPPIQTKTLKGSGKPAPDGGVIYHVRPGKPITMEKPPAVASPTPGAH